MKEKVVTFPVCAPAHLVLPGAQSAYLVSCLAIMSVWSRSKQRICWQQSMECTDTTATAVRHVGVRALFGRRSPEKINKLQINHDAQGRHYTGI